jgi:ABC-type nitrate/sulfonate/bicarbonate transport system substrate-binding protein
MRQVGHQERLDSRVVVVRVHESVAGQDALGVRIGDKDRPASCIEGDGVRRLGSDARNGKQLSAERGEGKRQQPPEAPSVTRRDVAREGAEPPRLHPKGPGRTEQRREPDRGQREHCVEVERPRGAQPRDRPLGVAPRRVLREDRSHDDLEAGAGRPPALWAVTTVEPIVEPEQAATARCRVRQERRRPQHGELIIRRRHAVGRRNRALAWCLVLTGCLMVHAAEAQPASAPLSVTVAVGGPPEEPAYLPVHAAMALGTFEAEGLQVTLKRAKHPTAAVATLRDREAGIAVTTLDNAIRGAWARKLPVQVLVAHVRAPALALLVAPAARDTVHGVEDLKGKAVGIPGPGTTGHLLLAQLLRSARLKLWEVDARSIGTTALLAQLGGGDLAAAMVEEPWVSRLLDSGRAGILVDFRRPAETERIVGGPFYEVVSVAVTPPPKDDPKSKAGAEAKKGAPAPIEPPPEAILAAYARAIARVQVWLATTPPTVVAERLPPALVRDRARFAAQLGAEQAAYAGAGEPTVEGLQATLRVLRGGASPWPVSLSVSPEDLASPPAVTAARHQLGPTPPPP